MALVIVLWVLVILVVMAWGLAATTQTETRLVGNYSQAARCLQYARAGIVAMCQELQQTNLVVVTANEPASQQTSEEIGLEFEEGGGFDLYVEDEAGKVNLNTATAEMLTKLTGDADVAAAILDWRDEDNSMSAGGAEDAYYLGLPEPYHCKNALFETVEEVLLVKGMTPELFYGSTAGKQPLNRLLTVYSVDENVDSRGRQRLNINTASESELKDRLGDVLSDQDIKAVLDFRSGESSKAEGPRPPAQTNPSKRTFESIGDLLTVSGISREKMAKVADRVSVSDAKSIPGRININTADRAVLACLPGMDEATADEIVEYRLGEEGPFSDVGEILKVDSVTNDMFRKIADLITVRSTAFAVTSTGRIEGSRARRHIRCVVCLIRPGREQTQQTAASRNTSETVSFRGRDVQLRYWKQGE